MLSIHRGSAPRRGILHALLALLCAALLSSFVAAPAAALRDGLSEKADRLREGLVDEELDALTTLALADEGMRDAILDASLHPEVLGSIGAIQDRSSEAFRARLEGEERATQQDVWELARYPELVDALVLGGRPSRSALDEVVSDYPERIQEIARGLAEYHFEVLNDIAAIREEAERETAQTLKRLPLATQGSFESLIERPDLLSAMLDEPEVVERLGNLVRDDAWNARSVFDREHELASATRERELEQWRESIENDPEAQEQLRESAREFAEDEGYEAPEVYASETRDTHRHHHHHDYHHPYPWWFGTPHWRVGTHWYPHHTHWGFHVSLGGGIAIHSIPSPIFSYWHYKRPRHYGHRYRHLHGHWNRYGPRHHLHRDYKHRVHARKHFRKEHRHHRGYRGRHHGDRDRKRRHEYRDGGRDRYVNKFFRHSGSEKRYERERPRRRVERDRSRGDRQRMHRVAKRDRPRDRDRDVDRKRKRRGDRDENVRDGKRRRGDSSRDKRMRSASKRERNKFTSRRDDGERKRNRLTSSATKKSKKKRVQPGKRKKSNKFTKASSNRSSNKVSKKFKTSSKKKSYKKAKKKTNRKFSKKSSKKRSPKKQAKSRKSGKSGKKSKGSKKKGKFFARR